MVEIFKVLEEPESSYIHQFEAWLKERQITEVECLVADMSGVARGKILPTTKFLQGLKDGLRLPESIFVQTIGGDYPDDGVTSAANSDIYLYPDPNTLRVVPWYTEPSAQVISDCYYADGRPVSFAPRQVLRHILSLYEEQGWQPVVAPEVEFFLVSMNPDPDYPLKPPIGRSGRAEAARQSYGIDAVNEFDPLFEEIYAYCDKQDIDIDTLSHEAGAAQMEINFNHGDALDLADEVFLFKRTVRQAALSKQIYATFMAKPMENEPGSAMHIHQSVLSVKTGKNIFANKDESNSKLFLSYIAGLQKYLPCVMPLIAPNVNSYRRLRRYSDAPINVHWGMDNRTTGLRVPLSSGKARRVENRIPGADANPYLALAATLACGYLGMTQNLKPTKPVAGSAYEMQHTLPQYLPDALRKMERTEELGPVLGEDFLKVLAAIKESEYDAYQRVISSWEREFLLLSV